MIVRQYGLGVMVSRLAAMVGIGKRHRPTPHQARHEVQPIAPVRVRYPFHAYHANGAQECARRRRQIASGFLTAANGLVR